jgi:hypothetical protein
MGQERRFGHIEPMSVLPPLATAMRLAGLTLNANERHGEMHAFVA